MSLLTAVRLNRAIKLTVPTMVVVVFFTVGLKVGEFRAALRQVEEFKLSAMSQTANDPSLPTFGDDKKAKDKSLQQNISTKNFSTKYFSAKYMATKYTATKLEQPLADLSQSMLAKELVEKVEPLELIELAAATTFLEQDELLRMENPTRYLKSLFDVATQKPTANVGPGELSPLYFSKTISADNTAEYPQNTFSTSDSAIYAAFQTVGYAASGRVIVRWFDIDRNKIVSFQRYAINPEQHNHYLWTRPAQGWQPGAYEVGIYLDDETLTQISQGDFYVVPSDV